MIQKILKVGDSIGITIPKKTAQELGLSAGDSVEFTVNKDRNVISIRATEQQSARDRKITEMTLNFIERYREDLEELARK